MKKSAVIGIVVAAAVIIGVISAFSFTGNLSLKTDKLASDKDKKIGSTQPVIKAKRYSVNLTEDMGTGSSP